MVRVLFFILLVLGWGALAMWSHAYVVGILALISLTLFYIVGKKSTVLLPKPLLLSGKVILSLSLWGCIAFCLLAYQRTITCTNCMIGYLSRDIEPIFGAPFSIQNMRALWELYPRFITMFSLVLVWAAVFYWTAIHAQRRKK